MHMISFMLRTNTLPFTEIHIWMWCVDIWTQMLPYLHAFSRKLYLHSNVELRRFECILRSQLWVHVFEIYDKYMYPNCWGNTMDGTAPSGAVIPGKYATVRFNNWAQWLGLIRLYYPLFQINFSYNNKAMAMVPSYKRRLTTIWNRLLHP